MQVNRFLGCCERRPVVLGDRILCQRGLSSFSVGSWLSPWFKMNRRGRRGRLTSSAGFQKQRPFGTCPVEGPNFSSSDSGSPRKTPASSQPMSGYLLIVLDTTGSPDGWKGYSLTDTEKDNCLFRRVLWL